MELINILGIVVLVVGIILIGVEFYLPGFGVPGITGIVCTVAGIYLAGRDNGERIFIGVIAIVIIAVMLVISICIFKSKKIKSPIKLETDMQGKNLFIEEKDMEYLLGKKGVACTDLRPSGKGEFNGVKLDILSDGEFIKKGVKITVTEIKNNKIFVREDK
ncbi:MAG: serine protease [Lachnospiraceae bacterium]|jgi:membrane-bound ClpP family serine protease|nr:serine protease [Lachnospiraceae bacterium]